MNETAERNLMQGHVFDIEASGLSDRGKIRAINEDAIGVFSGKRFFVIADGMGGYADGDKASAVTVDAVAEFFTNELLDELGEYPDRCRTALPEAVMHAHGKTLDAAAGRNSGLISGSTIALSFIHGRYLHVCHVGDSRVYIINQSGITQLTDDHSNVGDLVRMGKMSPEEARTSPLRNQVSQALGSPFGIRPEYRRQPLCHGDIILLCTDGLWDMVDNKCLLETVRAEPDLERCCRALVDAANAAGGEDNVSVILVRVRTVTRS